jgi:hypothetical protein
MSAGESKAVAASMAAGESNVVTERMSRMSAEEKKSCRDKHGS